MPDEPGEKTSNGNTGTDARKQGEWSKEDMDEAVPMPMPEVDDESDDRDVAGSDPGPEQLR